MMKSIIYRQLKKKEGDVMRGKYKSIKLDQGYMITYTFNDNVEKRFMFSYELKYVEAVKGTKKFLKKWCLEGH